MWFRPMDFTSTYVMSIMPDEGCLWPYPSTCRQYLLRLFDYEVVDARLFQNMEPWNRRTQQNGQTKRD